MKLYVIKILAWVAFVIGIRLSIEASAEDYLQALLSGAFLFTGLQGFTWTVVREREETLK